MRKKCLIYIDQDHPWDSCDLIEVANQMYEDGQLETYAVILGGNKQEKGVFHKEPEKDAICAYFDFCIHVHSPEGVPIQSYDVLNITNCIEELQNRYKFDCILIPATHVGRMLAPRIAMRLRVGLVADVTSIGHQGETVEMVRPAFDGKILAAITSQNSSPIMMSVRPNVFKYNCENDKKHVSQEDIGTKIVNYTPVHIEETEAVLLESYEKEKAKDIRDCDILISGGGGVSDNFGCLNSLAEELNGMVAASRRIVDSGIAPRAIQVGQSGKTVSPKLYIALGIYGSLQHIEGLKDVENLIVVNTSKNAPLCSLADMVVEGDAVEFIEKLVKRVKQGKDLEQDK